jgi:hypothetical protein
MIGKLNTVVQVIRHHTSQVSQMNIVTSLLSELNCMYTRLLGIKEILQNNKTTTIDDYSSKEKYSKTSLSDISAGHMTVISKYFLFCCSFISLHLTYDDTLNYTQITEDVIEFMSWLYGSILVFAKWNNDMVEVLKIVGGKSCLCFHYTV